MNPTRAVVFSRTDGDVSCATLFNIFPRSATQGRRKTRTFIDIGRLPVQNDVLHMKKSPPTALSINNQVPHSAFRFCYFFFTSVPLGARALHFCKENGHKRKTNKLELYFLLRCTLIFLASSGSSGAETPKSGLRFAIRGLGTW